MHPVPEPEAPTKKQKLRRTPKSKKEVESDAEDKEIIDLTLSDSVTDSGAGKAGSSHQDLQGGDSEDDDLSDSDFRRGKTPGPLFFESKAEALAGRRTPGPVEHGLRNAKKQKFVERNRYNKSNIWLIQPPKLLEDAVVRDPTVCLLRSLTLSRALRW